VYTYFIPYWIINTEQVIVNQYKLNTNSFDSISSLVIRFTYTIDNRDWLDTEEHSLQPIVAEVDLVTEKEDSIPNLP